MTNGRSARCARRPTRRRSSRRRVARPGRPNVSAWAARFATRASTTRWPTTNVSASGVACPSGSVAASSAASSEPRCAQSSSIDGSMTEGSTPKYVATWATRTSCSNSASSMVSFARRSIGLRNNTIRARVEFPRTSTPAGIRRASAIGPSATTSAGHCTLSGSFGDDPRDLVDGDVERGQPVLPTSFYRLVGLQHRHVEPLGPAAPPRHRGGKQRAAYVAAAACSPGLRSTTNGSEAITRTRGAKW